MLISFNEFTIAAEIGLIYGILALGIFLTFRIINFPDLTCDGSFITGAAISSVLIRSGVNPFIALIGAIVGGGLAGLLTGILNVYFKISDLLSGVIVAFMLYSINLRIMGENPNISLVNFATMFGNSSLIVIFLLVFVLIIALTFLLLSDFGLGVRIIGENPQLAMANGINVNAMIIFGLALSNALVGLCGAMFTQYQGFCDISQGVGCLVIGLASVIIGEKAQPIFNSVCCVFQNITVKTFFSIFCMLICCVLGSMIYRLFMALAINSDFFGLKTQDINLVTGLLMIFIMCRRKKC